jgi:hypothetical protein
VRTPGGAGGCDRGGFDEIGGLEAYMARPAARDAAFASFRVDHPPLCPGFLYEESLGGAIALFLHLLHKNLWHDGAVLNDAMCGVSPRFKPQWPLKVEWMPRGAKVGGFPWTATSLAVLVRRRCLHGRRARERDSRRGALHGRRGELGRGGAMSSTGGRSRG